MEKNTEIDKENKQTLLQAIQQKYGAQNASEASKSQSPALIIPQLKMPLPQLNINNNKAMFAEAQTQTVAKEEAEARRVADAHNELLFNAIRQRRQDNANMEAGGQSTDYATTQLIIPPLRLPALALDKLPSYTCLSGGFTIPKLRTAAGEPLDEPVFDIPLLNKLRAQTDKLQLAQDMGKLKIAGDDGGDGAKQNTRPIPIPPVPVPSMLIDLTTTVIPVSQNAPPRESASKMRLRQAAAAAASTERFDIPFIACDRRQCRLSDELLARKRRLSVSSVNEASSEEGRDSASAAQEEAVKEAEAAPSDVGRMLDSVLGYPAAPRQPQLKYASSPLEWRHLKMYKLTDYGSNIKRFCFDTPSPDEVVKEALQKSWRISRT